MSGIVRDFSLSSVEHLKNIIKQNVDEDGELFLVDWVKDWFIDDLDINDYINDIDTYHAKMVDKYDISTKKFDQILNKVHAVDISYADRFNSIYEGLSSFNALIMNVTALIDPSAVTLDQNAYEELLSGIENIHAENMEVVNKTIENDDAELDDALREVPWYETALDFVAGAGVEFSKNTLEGIALIPFGIIDGIFGTNFNENLSSSLDYLEESYVLPHIGNKTAYYYGRAAGDVITMVAGAYGMVKGIVTIAGGITITGGGVALSATGVGSIIGGPAIAVSVPVVLAGAAELGISAAVFANGYDNLNDNIKMASTDKVSEISSSKQSSVESNLDNIESSGEGLKFKEGYYKEHTTGPVEKFTERNGVSGGHNYDEFNNYFKNSDKYSLSDVEVVQSNIDGLSDVKYKVKVEKKDFRGNPTGEFKEIPPGERYFTKTVYDPAKISSEQIDLLSKEAMSEGLKNQRVTPLTRQNKVKIYGETNYNGVKIKFEGLKNLDTGEIENAWPVLKWELE